MNNLATVLAVVGGFSSIFSIFAVLRGIKKDRQEATKEAKERAVKEAEERAEMHATQKQMLIKLTELTQAFEKHLGKYDDLRDRVTKVEDRADDAHRRIDEMEERIK